MDNTFAISLKQQEKFAFKVNWQQDSLEPLLTDEPKPLGEGKGPNPTRMLAAAVANCLSASLLFALGKFGNELSGLEAKIEGTVERNDDKRWRVSLLEVQITLPEEIAKLNFAERALNQFESFCVVTESVREGIPVHLSVQDSTGKTVHQSEK